MTEATVSLLLDAFLALVFVLLCKVVYDGFRSKKTSSTYSHIDWYAKELDSLLESINHVNEEDCVSSLFLQQDFYDMIRNRLYQKLQKLKSTTVSGIFKYEDYPVVTDKFVRHMRLTDWQVDKILGKDQTELDPRLHMAVMISEIVQRLEHVHTRYPEVVPTRPYFMPAMSFAMWLVSYNSALS